MSHLNARTPTGGDVIQRSDTKPAFSDNLLEQVMARPNLRAAWQRVRANKGAAGVDGMSLDEFPAWARAGNWQRIVTDRVIQQAIAQVLTPLFDPGFSDHSFGFRPKRNGQQAVQQVQRYIQEGRRIAVDVDLSKFFDRVNHDLLMTHLGYKVQENVYCG